MKRALFLAWILIFSVFISEHAFAIANSFPSFPMTVWGTLKDGSREIATWATLKFYDGSGVLLSEYVTGQSGRFGSDTPSIESPTFPSYSGSLAITVSFSGKTFSIGTGSIDDSLRGSWCPMKDSISFVQKVCRYDIDIVSAIDPLSISGTLTATGGLDFGSETSTGVTFSASGSIVISDTSGSGNSVSIPVFSWSALTASGNWDGVFRSPEFVSSSGNISVSGYERISSLNFEIGSDTTPLSLSGGKATVRLNVGNAYDWKTLKVYRSHDKQSTFSFLSDCVVNSWICEFQTDKFSVFAVMNPVTVAAVASGNSGGGSSGWGSSGSSTSVTSSTATNNSGTTSTGAVTYTGTVVPSKRKANIKKPSNKTGFTGTYEVKLHDAKNSFAKNEIGYLISKNVISWYSDSSFKPKGRASRAEFLKIVLKGLNVAIPAPDKNSKFSDTNVDWQNSVAKKAKELGIISGQTIGSKLVFRPNDPITRAEAMKILLRAAKISTNNGKDSDFQDLDNNWAAPYANKAKELGIISGQTIGGKLVFRPNDPITREEAAKIVVRTIFSK